MTASASSSRWLANPLVPYPKRSCSCRRHPSGEPAAERRGGGDQRAGDRRRRPRAASAPCSAGSAVMPAPTAARTRGADGSAAARACAAPYRAAYQPAQRAPARDGAAGRPARGRGTAAAAATAAVPASVAAGRRAVGAGDLAPGQRGDRVGVRGDGQRPAGTARRSRPGARAEQHVQRRGRRPSPAGPAGGVLGAQVVRPDRGGQRHGDGERPAPARPAAASARPAAVSPAATPERARPGDPSGRDRPLRALDRVQLAVGPVVGGHARPSRGRPRRAASPAVRAAERAGRGRAGDHVTGHRQRGRRPDQLGEVTPAVRSSHRPAPRTNAHSSGPLLGQRVRHVAERVLEEERQLGQRAGPPGARARRR